jgi:hypothetical protein
VSKYTAIMSGSVLIVRVIDCRALDGSHHSFPFPVCSFTPSTF